jgi:hypothetical protein
MPGTVYELELTEALAIVATSALDPTFPWYASDGDRLQLLQEAQRVAEAAAHEAACRCLTPIRKPHLRIVSTTQETEHDRRRRRDAADDRARR